MSCLSRVRACAIALGLIGAMLAATPTPETDESIIAEMQRRIKALQHQAIETQDPAATARLHADIDTIMEDALGRVSAKSRPMLEIGLKLMRPLSEEGVAYTEASSAFFDSPLGDPSTIKERSEIATRIGALEKLAAQNQRLLDRINAMETEAEKLIRKSTASAAEREAFMTGYRQSSGRNLGALRAIRSLDAKVLQLWIDLLGLLDREWGNWHPRPDGGLDWTDPDAEKQVVAIVEEMHVLADRQIAAQKKLVGAN